MKTQKKKIPNKAILHSHIGKLFLVLFCIVLLGIVLFCFMFNDQKDILRPIFSKFFSNYYDCLVCTSNKYHYEQGGCYEWIYVSNGGCNGFCDDMEGGDSKPDAYLKLIPDWKNKMRFVYEKIDYSRRNPIYACSRYIKNEELKKKAPLYDFVEAAAKCYDNKILPKVDEITNSEQAEALFLDTINTCLDSYFHSEDYLKFFNFAYNNCLFKAIEDKLENPEEAKRIISKVNIPCRLQAYQEFWENYNHHREFYKSRYESKDLINRETLYKGE